MVYVKVVNYGLGGTIILCDCDGCKSNNFYPTTNFLKVNHNLKDNGWIIRKVGGKWVDFCCEQCYDNYTRKYMDKVYDHLSNGEKLKEGDD